MLSEVGYTGGQSEKEELLTCLTAVVPRERFKPVLRFVGEEG